MVFQRRYRLLITSLVTLFFYGAGVSYAMTLVAPHTVLDPVGLPGAYSVQTGPAGSSSSIQYNDAGAFGADPNFTRNPLGTDFNVISDIGTGVSARIQQSSSVLGIGIKGTAFLYSDNNYVSSFTGIVAGDFTAVGGEANAMLIGYQAFSGGTSATITPTYDAGSDTSTIGVSTKNSTGKEARVGVQANPTGGNISFNFGGSNNYYFPDTEPTIGTVLGYTGSHQLGWVSAGGGGGVTIGNPITGGTGDRILFEDASNNLRESNNLIFVDTTGYFDVSFAGSTHFLSNPSSGQYYMGTNGGNKTLIQILDGGTNEISNSVNGQFYVQQTNGPRLIDGNTNTFNLYLGDVGHNANTTSIELLDSAAQIHLVAHSTGIGSSGLIEIGDRNNDGNSTKFSLNDFARQVFVQTNGDFGVQNFSGQRAIDVDFSSGFYFAAGDANAVANGTKLTVNDSTSLVTINAANGLVVNDNNSHTCTVDPNGGTCTSDERLKTNITDLPSTTLNTLAGLRTVTYTWNSGADMTTKHIGFLAQNVRDAYPELVSTDPNGYLGVNYPGFTPLLVEALKEVKLQLDSLDTLITTNTSFTAHMREWLGDTANGIARIFADKVETHELCVDGQCLNEQDVRDLLQLRNQVLGTLVQS